jgi:hypothetical protein
MSEANRRLGTPVIAARDGPLGIKMIKNRIVAGGLTILAALGHAGSAIAADEVYLRCNFSTSSDDGRGATQGESTLRVVGNSVFYWDDFGHQWVDNCGRIFVCETLVNQTIISRVSRLLKPTGGVDLETTFHIGRYNGRYTGWTNDLGVPEHEARVSTSRGTCTRIASPQLRDRQF